MFRQTLSLAEQVKQELVQQITAHGFNKTQGQLPSEPELSRRLGVSRSTIREALTMLEREGKIVRKHGVGTFINDNFPGLSTPFTEVVEFEDLITQHGYQASVEVQDVRLDQAGTYAPHLQILPEEQVIVVDKIFLADEKPVIQCHNLIPLKVCHQDFSTDLLDLSIGRLPVYRFLQEYGDQEVLYQISDVKAAIADEQLAKNLHCPLNSPLLKITEIGYNDNQKPILFCEEYFRNEMVYFPTIRKVVRPFSWENE